MSHAPDDKTTILLIFGASGDLTQRKLIPALYNLYRKRRLPGPLHIVGSARTSLDHTAFREKMRQAVQAFSAETFDPETWRAFTERLWYIPGSGSDPAELGEINRFLNELAQGPHNRLYYLSVAPSLYMPIIHNLGALGMSSENAAYCRIIIEKPFGVDLESAQALNQDLHRVFDESQIYRIDHYLGKETAQNILFLRFANTIFEPVWNRNYVDNIQITVAETVDVGHRAAYYDQSGVLRDMFQNHLLQLLALIAMEPPASFNATALRNEKVKILNSIRPAAIGDTVRAQYRGYATTPGVAPGSTTPTYAALKLYVDNWRWYGVPFYLRSGKALAAKTSQIRVRFRCPPHLMFPRAPDEPFTPNTLSICIQPNEGIHLNFEAKVPDSTSDTRSVNMDFRYRNAFGDGQIPDAYERLLLDALHGDASLFTRSDEIEAAWRLIDPILAAWETPNAPPLTLYKPGSWGPAAADRLLRRDGHVWRLGCADA